MNAAQPPIVIAPLSPDDRPAWEAFVAASPSGTLFHSQAFFDYHPSGRFRFEHLLARQAGRVVAVIPGGLTEKDGQTIYASPLGASFGGPAMERGFKTGQALALVQALQEWVEARGYAGMNLTLPPAIFSAAPSELLSFALFARGFRLGNRWLCAALDLASAAAPRHETLFRKRQVTHVRASRREGLVLGEYGVEGLPAFLGVFDDTYARHGVAATHSPEEIAWLLERLPDRVRLYLAMQDDRCAAGVLALHLTPAVTYTFYICASTELASMRGNLFLYAALADRLADQGVRWLDLGPASWDGNYNAGVTFFKESLGCTLSCRDRWTWRTGWDNGPALSRHNFMESAS